MSELRALLLTDVVDSTALSESLGDAAMAEVWAQHDRAARDLLPLWRGREIDKTDGMLLLFDGVADALGYALAYHAALAAMPVPLRARAGLHWAAVILRENSADDVQRGAKPLEVDGLAKPMAARIMALAQGAQTLLSADALAQWQGVEAASAAADAPTLTLQSHGHWVLKGVSEPIELFEVAPGGTDLRAPPDAEKAYRVVQQGERWMPVREIANNLPQQISTFIGREQELRDIKSLLGSARLVTLLGMGGLGKTRLSLQAAAELMHRFPDGVWFLDLSPISDPNLALAEAAQVLGVRQEPERTLLQSVCAYLKERRALLIFDNCEHLIKASADLAHAIIKAAPHVRLAASSREALRIPGERVYPILPLPVPSETDSLAVLLQSTAVRLFVDRARSHRPTFELTEDEAPAVAALVARLEGIPLALELAAARVRSLSVADINRRLSDRYKILTGGSRVLQQRQQTLRALVDWSYDMLPAPEQTLLQRLAPFRGEFDLEAVETVCAAEPLAADDMLDVLSLLVEKSLVMLVDEGGQTRYRMLETIREYAAEKLEQSGDAPATHSAHCHYFFELAKQARNGLRGAAQGEWLKRLEADQDNLRAALVLAQADEGLVDPLITVKMAVALQAFWILRGHASEGRKAVQAMLALPAVQAQAVPHAHALYVAAALAWSQSDHGSALRDLDTCLALRRSLGNAEEIAATLSTIAIAKLSCGDGVGARAANLEALALFQQCAYAVGEATVLLQLGQIELYLGDDDAAAQYLQSALAFAKRIKNLENEAETELGCAQLAYERGELALMEAALAHSLKVCLAAGDRRGAANALWWQAKADLSLGRLPLVGEKLTDAITAFNTFEMREQLVGCLQDHVVLALAVGRAELAVELASAVDRLHTNAGLRRSERAQARWLGLMEKLRQSQLAQSQWDALWGAGAQWETGEALRAALRLSAGAARGHTPYAAPDAAPGTTPYATPSV